MQIEWHSAGEGGGAPPSYALGPKCLCILLTTRVSGSTSTSTLTSTLNQPVEVEVQVEVVAAVSVLMSLV